MDAHNVWSPSGPLVRGRRGSKEAQLNARHFTRLVCPERGSGEHAGWAEGTFTQTEIGDKF
jgi:hypothetical protein